MDCSTPGFPVQHQLLKLAQIHVHRVGDAIQPSHPLLSPTLGSFEATQTVRHTAEKLELLTIQNKSLSQL